MSGEVENRATIEAFWLAYNEERLGDCIKIYAPEARLRHPSLGIDVSGRDGRGSTRLRVGAPRRRSRSPINAR